MNNDDYIFLTEDMIEEGRSYNNGFNRKQLECFGIGWPPPKGWKKGMVGKKVNKLEYEMFLKFKKGEPAVEENLF